jgi:Fe-S-cluster containining protein
MMKCGRSIVMMFKQYLSKMKIGRFINSYMHRKSNRKGECMPDQCETHDGQKGAACCKLGYSCPALCNNKCRVYNIRPRNCRSFPANEDDLKLVKNCGYWWD